MCKVLEAYWGLSKLLEKCFGLSRYPLSDRVSQQHYKRIQETALRYSALRRGKLVSMSERMAKSKLDHQQVYAVRTAESIDASGLVCLSPA